MSHTIFVRNLSIQGIHGLTKNSKPKLFTLDIEVSVDDITRAALTDNIDDVFDYRDVVAIARRVIAGPPVHLIETLASRIADEILKLPRTQKIKLTLSKREFGDEFDSGIIIEHRAYYHTLV